MGKPTGRLAVMGNITCLEGGEEATYNKALLIVFDSPEDVRQAVSDMDFDMVHYHDSEEEVPS